jgi:hypothetical protein
LGTQPENRCKLKEDMRWFTFILASLATFRLSHLVAKERGPLAIFERLRHAMPGGRGSAKEWLSCIFCFSLSASALVCLILWCAGQHLSWGEWVLSWLGFSAVALIINQVFGFSKIKT